MSSSLTTEDFLGKIVLHSGDTPWFSFSLGAFAYAFVNGCWIFLDEVMSSVSFYSFRFSAFFCRQNFSLELSFCSSIWPQTQCFKSLSLRWTAVS